MKKIILLIFSLFIILINTNTKAEMAKKINLKTKPGEVNVIFLKLKNSTSLVINTLNKDKLYFIDCKNTKGINKVMDIFDINPEMYWTYKCKYTTKNKKNIIKMNVNGYRICIVKNLSFVNNCDFVYLDSLNKEFHINEKIMSVFYNEEIKEKYLLSLNESWVDSNEVSLNNFTILKINKSDFNILIVPLANK